MRTSYQRPSATLQRGLFDYVNMQTRIAFALGRYTYKIRIELSRIELSTNTYIKITTLVKNDHHPCIPAFDHCTASF